ARYFFFSSRRRHTRWPRDWSSDVCSSDLIEQAKGKLAERLGLDMDQAFSVLRGHARTRNLRLSDVALAFIDGSETLARTGAAQRSEERRVGKECRSEWSR